MSTEPLLFASTALHVDATLWGEVERRKLNDWRLTTPVVPLAATIRSPLAAAAYSQGLRDGAAAGALMLDGSASVSVASFRTPVSAHVSTAAASPSPARHADPTSSSSSEETLGATAANGEMPRTIALTADFLNYNMIEELQGMDRKAALRPVVERVTALAAKAQEKEDADAVVPWAEAPLTRAAIFSFADLKGHVFTYCAAVPVVDFSSATLSSLQCTGRTDAVTARTAGGLDGAAWWTAVRREVAARSATVASGGNAEAHDVETVTLPVPFVVALRAGAGPLAGPVTRAALERVAAGDAAIAMVDASGNGKYPSQLWRNVIAALRLTLPSLTTFSILCVRSAALDASSVVFNVSCASVSADPAYQAATGGSGSATPLTVNAALAEGAAVLKAVGWSEKGRRVDLSAIMDTTKLADSSANLNLSLMKWRMLPTLDLDRISGTKALLLGSGTLGCNIARHLMMWGVRKITMLDRGNVSHSNPVRQTLFELTDVTAEGENRVKSVAAANRLKKILPTMDAVGVNLEIRMPGHRIDPSAEAAARADIERLRDLILAHDVVFLLTDSRESRWLPTVLCMAHDKPVINAALAFDSYLVQRHGLRSQGVAKVGCYFCNDVVAPLDSLSQRSLDQQCTVTRPGVSAMASALAVELLASLLNHPQGFNCPAFVDSDGPAFDPAYGDVDEDEASTVLGILPHQLRGNVSRTYECSVMRARAFNKCTACSDAVVATYLKDESEGGGVNFLLQCINDPPSIERLTGLEADREALEEMGADCDFDSDEDE
jgi:ubiquitin-like modifier-activating enzyme ATG7